MYFPFLPIHFNPYYYQNAPNTPLKQQPTQELQKSIQSLLKVEQQNCKQFAQQNSNNLSIDINELKKAGYQQKKQSWSTQQDRKLLLLVDKKLKWVEIAAQIPSRTIKMCYSRYKRIVKRESRQYKRGIWSSDEDRRLIELVDIHGQAWKELAVYFQDRKPKQLRQRYINTLTPNISKEPWTLEQDLLIIQFYNKLGKKWKNIASHLKNRSQNQLKNRFYGRILPLSLKKHKNKI